MSILKSNIIRIFIILLFAGNIGYGQEELDGDTYEETYEDDAYNEDEDDGNEQISLLNLAFSLNQAIEPMSRNVEDLKVGFKASFFRSFKKHESLSAGLVIHNFRFDRLVLDHVLFGDFEDFNVTTATTTKMLFTGIGLRYYTNFYTEKLEPYIQGELGVNHVYTKSLEQIEGAEEGNFSYQTYHGSIGYMMGIGVQYNVGFLTAVHFTTNFHGSSASRYYVAEDLGEEIPWDNFRLRKGQVNFISNTIGITFGF